TNTVEVANNWAFQIAVDFQGQGTDTLKIGTPSGAAVGFIFSMTATGGSLARNSADPADKAFSFSSLQTLAGNSGSDTLNLIALSNQTVDQLASGTNGYSGRAATLSVNFSGIDIVAGGGGANTLQGNTAIATDSAVWTINQGANLSTYNLNATT